MKKRAEIAFGRVRKFNGDAMKECFTSGFKAGFDESAAMFLEQTSRRGSVANKLIKETGRRVSVILEERVKQGIWFLAGICAGYLLWP